MKDDSLLLKYVTDPKNDGDYVLHLGVGAAVAEATRELSSLLQQMLDVAENCDETGYIDGEGFVDLDKLHAKVRAALAKETKP